MIGIYHSKDLDGYTSGAIIKLKYPDVKLYGYNYGEELKLPSIKNEDIIMSDVSLGMHEMELIGCDSKSFTWIDHHISSINDFKEYSKDKDDFLIPVLENGIAACEGTWKHLFPDTQMPLAVQLLGEYDTWRNQDKDRWDNIILPFQFGMKSLCSSPESFPVELFENDELVDEIISKGKIILEYQNIVNEKQCKSAGFEAVFEGLNAICLNGGGFNSGVFNSVYDENKHDIMVCFQTDGEYWRVSLYTTKDSVDCSKLAKKRGGGGHKKASGFEANDYNDIFD